MDLLKDIEVTSHYSCMSQITMQIFYFWKSNFYFLSNPMHIKIKSLNEYMVLKFDANK